VRGRAECSLEAEDRHRDRDEHDQVLPPLAPDPHQERDRGDCEDQVDELDRERACRG
jgi:hypothetical protein